MTECQTSILYFILLFMWTVGWLLWLSWKLSGGSTELLREKAVLQEQLNFALKRIEELEDEERTG